MPRVQIATTQAKYTLEQLHAELGGKILDNKKEAARLAQAMKRVEAILKMIELGYDVRPIAVRRRKPNPYFKRGTVFRCALDVLRAAERPLTIREIAFGYARGQGCHRRLSQGRARLIWCGPIVAAEPQGRQRDRNMPTPMRISSSAPTRAYASSRPILAA
jgi:hypothetical protein